MKVRFSFQRRGILCGAIATLTLTAVPGSAYAISFVDLKGLAEVIDAAASALGKLADSIAHAIELGNEAITAVEAHKSLKTLKDMDARLGNLTHVGQLLLVSKLHDYVKKGREALLNAPTSASSQGMRDLWQAIVDQIREVLATTKTLLNEIQADRSDFVEEDARGVILESLQVKVGLMDRLGFARQAPKTAAELDEIDNIAAKYEVLRQQTVKATDSMSAYIKFVEKGPK